MNLYRERIIRCPRLGGEVPFSYCEREAGELPCRQVVRCWNAGFPVEEYLRETLTPEVWDRFRSEVPKDRMTTLLDIVESAKQRQKKEREAVKVDELVKIQKCPRIVIPVNPGSESGTGTGIQRF